METSPSLEPHLKEKHSPAIRLWHWVSVLLIFGSLITVLFAKTLFNTNDNITTVQNMLQKGNVTVTSAIARTVSHEFNDMIWHWHIYIGYVLASLLALRLIFEFFQPSQQKLIPLISKANRYLKQPGGDKQEAKHYLLVKYAYLLFYISLTIQAVTGVFMAYSDDIPELKPQHHIASNIHSVFMWVIISYIVLHIGGVIMAELGKKYKGIVSNMINGGE